MCIENILASMRSSTGSQNFENAYSWNKVFFDSESSTSYIKPENKVLIKLYDDSVVVVPANHLIGTLGETEKILTTNQLNQEILFGKFSDNKRMEYYSTNGQITQIKKNLGLNILELAAILRVSRPTIYEWMESKEIKMRKRNQQRLNALNEIGKTWKEKQLGRLGSYLHKPLNESKKSLFELLKSDLLDMDRIHPCLNNIAEVMITKREADKAHEALLRKHGFEPMSKEDLEDSLNDIDFMD